MEIPLKGPLSDPETRQEAAGVIAQDDKLRVRLIVDRSMLLVGSFPKVFADARRFVKETGVQPWAMHGYEGIAGDIVTKYDVFWHRRRPTYPDEIAEGTEVFIRCTEVAAEMESLLTPEYRPVVEQVFADITDEQNERLRRKIESQSPEDREDLLSDEEFEDNVKRTLEFYRWAILEENPKSN